MKALHNDTIFSIELILTEVVQEYHKKACCYIKITLPQVFFYLVPAMTGARLGQLENRGHVFGPLEHPGVELNVLSWHNGTVQ